MLTDEIAEVVRFHYPNPPATEAELDAFERANGFALDADLRTFYQVCNGAKLFQSFDSPYAILPLSKIVPANIAIYGPGPDAPESPDHVYAFCDVLDGNYAGFAVTPGKPYPIYDVFHEAWHLAEYRDVIAESFGEFLRRALRSKGLAYWLQGG